jgi:hypothetical protein
MGEAVRFIHNSTFQVTAKWWPGIYLKAIQIEVLKKARAGFTNPDLKENPSTEYVLLIGDSRDRSILQDEFMRASASAREK